MKKLIIPLLMLLMANFTFAQTSTAPAAGDGTMGNPWQIATLDNLYWLSQTPAEWVTGKYFVQSADIDATMLSPFPGIGSQATPFAGAYDGGGFQISNMHTESSTLGQPSGCFNAVSGATLSNIHLTNITCSSFYFAGALCGTAENSTITRCTSSGEVTAFMLGGGLIGMATSNTITKCASTANVTGSGFGMASDTEAGAMGGLIGSIAGSQASNTISDCYAKGIISGGQSIGGIIGLGGTDGNGDIDPTQGFTMTNCYAAAQLTATGVDGGSPAVPGGLFGHTGNTGSNISIISSYFDNTLEPNTLPTGGTGKTTAEMKTQSTFNGWDFATAPIWEIDASKNNGLPYLAWQVFASAAQPMQLVFTTTDFNQSIQLPLYGTVNCTVDWGDGTANEDFTTEGNKPHTFFEAGTYTVEISGSLTHFGDSENGAWSGSDFLTEVSDFGNLGLTSLNSAFYGAIILTSVPAILPSTVTDLSSCFSSGQSGTFTNLNLWDVSNVTSMNRMFSGNESFNQSLNNWDVSSVTDMYKMFYGAMAFNRPLNNWVVSNVTNMSSMFYGAESFNQALNNWDVSKVTRMRSMFRGAESFNQPLIDWIVSGVTNMSNMFEGAMTFNQPLNNWNVSNVTNMAYMFTDAESFNQPLNNWDVSAVEVMESMFDGVTLSTTNYDVILKAWAAQTVKPNVIFGVGDNQYSAGAAATARGVLSGEPNHWEIYDGGELASSTTDITTSTTASTQTLTPSSDIIVTSTGSMVIDQNTAVNTVTVQVGGKLTVNSGRTLNATVTLESSASGTGTLVDNYSIPTLTATVQQYLPQGRNWYVSVPTSSGNTSSFIGAGLASSVSYYNEVGGAWVDDYTGAMTAGRGYVAISAAGAGSATNNTSFSGTLNSGNVPVTLTRTGTSGFAGYNLIANPYPSYVNPMAALNALNVEKTIWYRTKGATYKFETVNVASGVGTNAAGTGQVTGYIPPFQAFWVRTNVTGQVLTFTNAMREHANPSGVTTTLLKAPSASAQAITRLKINGNTGTDETVLYFNTAASNSFDDYDSRKIFENDDFTIPEIYTQVGNEKLVINGLNTVQYETEIPLGFVVKQAGDFSISVNEFSNFETGIRLILKDKLYPTKETELSTEMAYNFSVSTANASSNRFSLLFRAPGVATVLRAAEKLNAQVFVNAANQISIVAPEKANYAIYNTVGMLLENATVNSKLQTANCKLQTGLYLVELSANGEKLTTRVIIK
ncbi:MAG: hypothetical protein AUK44_00360 [Porphyromonadaceae bacterium CG2_30_38_12]|nr:MAG: hypothetical protein AUK44_00360 [Porphyromonadaceae bacterium CG2_30_38_12]